MNKCVQNVLLEKARRPIEPLSAQIASKTAKMVPNGAKRALEMCPNHVQKTTISFQQSRLLASLLLRFCRLTL